ncbi:hypothetical protein AXG93_2351s1120 [Marchantia polymorpha subsp. ruderalis]|uniref:phosphoenolpyruvate carboxykinase (ATP) n=1 Tax=Marchantia polymorpha subsp. ruderalis TaxID=1480154 RepID=A0A176W4S7_MARPO|nr:hypothetical protein AXG93_2351s1120 [Marchantia polymorpha subsp. ruderalis]
MRGPDSTRSILVRTTARAAQGGSGHIRRREAAGGPMEGCAHRNCAGSRFDAVDSRANHGPDAGGAENVLERVERPVWKIGRRAARRGHQQGSGGGDGSPDGEEQSSVHTRAGSGRFGSWLGGPTSLPYLGGGNLPSPERVGGGAAVHARAEAESGRISWLQFSEGCQLQWWIVVMSSDGVSNGLPGLNGLSRIATSANGAGKSHREVCADDSVPTVQAQNVEELHSRQMKKSAPSTPRAGLTPKAGSTPKSDDDRQREQLESISTSLASLTRESGPQVVRGDPTRNKATKQEPVKGKAANEPSARVSDITDSALKFTHVLYNLSPAELYEQALKSEKGSYITSTGALATLSGAKTGRSPKDKRVVLEESSQDDLWWGKGSPNIEMDSETFLINRERAVDYLNSLEKVFVNDQFLNWDPENRIKVRIISARAYHSLFMYNMCIRPTPEELEDFGTPDFTIYNAGQFPCNRRTHYMSSSTSVDVNLKRREMVILGTQYAGEMKKGLFSLMHYLMPKRGILSLHSGCNMGKQGDVALFFGLSGTGKTTLSTDHNRYLIGDDEHCWSDNGVSNIEGGCYAKCIILLACDAFGVLPPAGDVALFFGLSGTGKTTLSTDQNRYLIGDDEHCWSDNGVSNIEGGCYAKCIDLSQKGEPDIWNAIKFGTVVENVVFDEHTREVDYADKSVTENTRAAYPIEFIPNAKIPCVGPHPKNIILLACDAFGVLPPVSKLTLAQTMYHFISGYTAVVAGTEDGVKEPTATFSACYGAAFIMMHPTKYASMLAEKMQKHGATAWLVNTGWSGGGYGVGSRMRLAYTRSIIDAIHDGSLLDAEYVDTPIFNLHVPKAVAGVPTEILQPQNSWKDKDAYNASLKKLAGLFQKNFKNFSDYEVGGDSNLTHEILAAGPIIE